MATAIGLAGSLFAPSRSGALVRATLDALAARGLSVRLIDLSQLPADALLARRKAPELDEVLAAVSMCQVLVVGTPIYRAAYSGQLKALFDLLPQNALAACVAGLIATGGIADHQLAIDHTLRPLVASLGGLSAARSIYATDAMFPAGAEGPLPEALSAAVNDLAAELVTLELARR
jgi:FMN reductase